jgi:hypothetical protein
MLAAKYGPSIVAEPLEIHAQLCEQNASRWPRRASAARNDPPSDVQRQAIGFNRISPVGRMDNEEPMSIAK